MSELADAIQAFLNAEDWDDTRAVLEAQQELLFSPEAEEVIADLIKTARDNENERAADMFELHLSILRAARDNGIAPVFEQIKALEEAKQEGKELPISPLAKAMQEFLNAEDWDATREVLLANQDLLFSDEAQNLLKELIGHAADNNNERMARVFELHMNILRAAQVGGIDEIFEQIKLMEVQAEAAMGGNGHHQHDHDHDHDPELEGVPFDVEQVMGTAVRAFIGSPEDRIAAVQVISEHAESITDHDALAFLGKLTQALIAGDARAAYADFEGVYEKLWEALLNAIERDGIDPDLLNRMMGNTFAVLREEPEHRALWLGELESLAAQMMAAGARRSGAFAYALKALIEANGDPTGLGADLDGIFAEAWQALSDDLK